MKHLFLLIISTSFIIFLPTIHSECQVSSINESPDESIKDLTLSSQLIESTIQRAISYKISNEAYLDDNMVYYTSDFFLYIFKDIECLKVPEIENTAYITSDISKLINDNKQQHPNLISVYVVLYRKSELLPQSFFYLYDQKTRQKIKVDKLVSTGIEFVTKSTVFVDKVAFVKEKYDYNIQNNINVFHSNDTLFNDHCFNFYDTNTTTDVVLYDRRHYIYVPLCDKNFTLLNIEWDDNYSSVKVTCKSTIKNVMTSPIMTTITGNNVNMFFDNEVTKGSGLQSFTCLKTAFKQNLFLKNFAFYLLLIFLFIQIIVMIIYFACYSGKYRDYLEYLNSKVAIIENEEDNINNIRNSFARRRSTYRSTQRRKSKLSKTAKFEHNRIALNDYDNDNNNLRINSHLPSDNFRNINREEYSNRRLDIERSDSFNNHNNNNQHSNNDEESNEDYENRNHGIILNLRNEARPNPPRRKEYLDNQNNNNSNGIDTNIETGALSKQVNTECVEPILRKKKTKRTKRVTIKANNKINNSNDISPSHDDNINNHNTNINTPTNPSIDDFERKKTVKNTQRTTLVRRGTKLASKRNTIRLSTGRRSTRRMSTAIVDSNFNDKEYDPHELITLTLEQAAEFDKRSVITVYLTTLCDKLFLIQLCNCGDISEPFLLRLFSFLFDIACILFFSTIFFNETYLSDRFIHAFNKTKKLNYAYVWTNESSKSAYAGLVSMVLIILMNCFIQTRTDLSKVNKKKKSDDFEEQVNQTLKKIKIKHVVIFIIDIILLALFWYYCTVFCNLFEKTQIALFLTAVNSTIFCIIFLLVIYLMFCIMRVFSLECKSNCLYRFSSFFL